MKRTVCIAALIAGACGAANAVAADGPWLVRARVLSMNVDNGNDPTLALGKVEASDELIPDIDISYFFTKHIAAELVLSFLNRHDVTLGGTKIGTIKQIPPTLLVQYHFLPDAQFRPYVGAGINYTRFTSVNLNAQPVVGVDLPVDIDKDSYGLALQVGADFKLTNNWFLNADVKWVKIETDVKAAGSKLTTLKIDPWLFGVGVGYRF